MPPERNPLTKRARPALLSCIVALGCVWPAPGEAEPQKRGYHLFHPTPDSLLRDLSADRPDVTESPYTVDAGHLQLEMDALRYSSDRQHGADGALPAPAVRSETWSVLVTNLKFGLDHATDLQIVAEWRRVQELEEESSGSRVETSGFGDVVLRLKRNLVGNDEGRIAVAALPYISFPTSTHGVGDEHVQFGIAIPVGVGFRSGWNLGVMGQADGVRYAEGRKIEWTATATLGHAILGGLGGFGEIAATFFPAHEGAPITTADAGLTYSLTPDLQIDAGIYAGMSDAADDTTLFLGLTARR